jgi:hypothetical protein
MLYYAYDLTSFKIFRSTIQYLFKNIIKDYSIISIRIILNLLISIMNVCSDDNERTHNMQKFIF